MALVYSMMENLHMFFSRALGLEVVLEALEVSVSDAE